jgi:hypothetical protein
LSKLTATETGDVLWKSISTKRLARLRLSKEQEQLVRKYVFYTPLPFVKRVVFICTPHRGSYQAGNFVRDLARRFVTLPDKVVEQQTVLFDVASRATGSRKVDRSLRTSMDSMSPRNPSLLALAGIPLAPGIHGHSIIAVQGEGDFTQGKDGVVSYSSAHVPYVESEYIVRSSHTCLSKPATIDEVRRILELHINSVPAVTANPVESPCPPYSCIPWRATSATRCVLRTNYGEKKFTEVQTGDN